MIKITIDENLCHKDGLCTLACTYGIFQQKEKDTTPEIDEVMLEKCYRCGHCVSICPHGAISHSHFAEGSVKLTDAEKLPSYDDVLELMRNRRSKRLFKDKPVERAALEKVLEAARFAPSQHNDQSTEFIVVQDKKIIQELTALTAEGIAKLAGYAKNPIARMMTRRAIGKRGAAALFELAPELEGLVELYKNGTDWILRNAPVLLLFCADSAGGTFSATNANLALHNAALAAETLGLGCFYAGFVIHSSELDGRIGKLVSLPETHAIYGALAIGYPRLKFNKWPERNPAKVAWL
jgi:nitroreductase/NAD-dependent dihydropyrimidine dehydrogenase PreA subunit